LQQQLAELRGKQQQQQQSPQRAPSLPASQDSVLLLGSRGFSSGSSMGGAPSSLSHAHSVGLGLSGHGARHGRAVSVDIGELGSCCCMDVVITTMRAAHTSFHAPHTSLLQVPARLSHMRCHRVCSSPCKRCPQAATSYDAFALPSRCSAQTMQSNGGQPTAVPCMQTTT
jgi:hypothetical protein